MKFRVTLTLIILPHMLLAVTLAVVIYCVAESDAGLTPYSTVILETPVTRVCVAVEQFGQALELEVISHVVH